MNPDEERKYRIAARQYREFRRMQGMLGIKPAGFGDEEGIIRNLYGDRSRELEEYRRTEDGTDDGGVS
ncbi:hypothetical protein IBTHAUMO2_990051 [Nitrosopumilaceae archaeon]|nr:hypothetical protein [Nitrosopumilus sp.]CAI9832819.1 hypothetical protein IBTHAUMO2_990051 [Nitrosopumilaceae archaeon]MDA7943648.1 hypothetical protein [Nitrosopumilus sp.]MDA7944363.1 hypothetical protein [Nitrosopumilus sp.]MDA7954115.1 hypothetical protein [Nitrosopumilus sp.]